MKVSNFSYELSKDLIASFPAEERDKSRLMVVDRKTGKIEHKIFLDLCEYLGDNDLLVFNNSKVIPARLYGKRGDGVTIELLLLNEIETYTWIALIKGIGKLRNGTVLQFKGDVQCVISEILEKGKAVVKFLMKERFYSWLNKNGTVPLPPYIKRNVLNEFDLERYQTIYAAVCGSVAAPTAGLHFSEKITKNLRIKGVETAYVTLHVGPGTFRPVRTDNIDDHIMDEESFMISQSEFEKINNSIISDKRIIAVGTTSVRTLESTAIESDGMMKNTAGKTGLFIKPGYRFKLVDALLTNFHLPESTLYILVCAFADIEMIKECYHTAIKEKYRFYSYGDAMLIL